MDRASWQGVMPAITNPYHEDLSIDHGRLADHVVRMADAGCTAPSKAGSSHAEASYHWFWSHNTRTASPTRGGNKFG